MAYHLTYEKSKGNYIPINITLASCFARLSNLKEDRTNLKEIDCFTSQFKDEAELKVLLVNEGLLDPNNINKKLSIRMVEKGKYIKVRHGLLYQRDVDYLVDPNELIKRINNKLLIGDYRFVDKFANNYLKYYDCSATAADVRCYASDSIRLGRRSKYFDELDENNDNVLVRMTKLLIYEYYQAQNGKIYYKDKIKYRNLHSIIAFTDNYDDTYANKNEEELLSVNNNVQSGKVRKKNKILEGQTSLFE